MSQHDTDFFNSHSLKYLEMALCTDYMERIENPDGYGKRTGDCGDTVEFFISGDGLTIRAASFAVQGCMNTTACSNTVARLAGGRSVEDAWKITPEQIIEYLETLPEDHHHCAELAVGAFYLALSDLTSRSK